MTVQYVGAHSPNINPDRKSLLSQQLRSNLLNLRQFEKCFIVARWIRNLFEDAISRPTRAERDVPEDDDSFRVDAMMVGQSSSTDTTSEDYSDFSLEQALPMYSQQSIAGMWSSSDVLQNYRDILSTCREQDWEDLQLED